MGKSKEIHQKQCKTQADGPNQIRDEKKLRRIIFFEAAQFFCLPDFTGRRRQRGPQGFSLRVSCFFPPFDVFVLAEIQVVFQPKQLYKKKVYGQGGA